MTREAAAGLAAASADRASCSGTTVSGSNVQSAPGAARASPSLTVRRAREGSRRRWRGFRAGSGAGRGDYPIARLARRRSPKPKVAGSSPVAPVRLLSQNGCKFIVPAPQMLVFRFGVLLPVRRVDDGELLGRHTELEQSVGDLRLPWCPLRSRRNCTGVKVRGKPVTRSRVLTLGAASEYADCSAVPNGTRARRINDK